MFRALGLYICIAMAVTAIMFELFRLADHVGKIFSCLATRGL